MSYSINNQDKWYCATDASGVFHIGHVTPSGCMRTGQPYLITSPTESGVFHKICVAPSGNLDGSYSLEGQTLKDPQDIIIESI